MTEKRFTICVDSNNLKSLWDDERTEEEPLLWLTLSDRIGGIDNVCELLNELNDENKELKLQLEAFKDKLCELGVSDVKLYGKRYYTGLEEWLE